jgi:hypothetical protein
LSELGCDRRFKSDIGRNGRQAVAVGAHVPACPRAVEHAINVLTLTARHGCSLSLNTRGMSTGAKE